MIIKDIRDFFSNDFINQYKNDYKAMRREIVEFMLKSTQYRETDYFHCLASSYYYGNNSNYIKLVRQLEKDLKLLKKFVKIGVLTNKDIKNFREKNKKHIREFITPKIKEFINENDLLLAASAMIIGGLTFAGITGGVALYRGNKIADSQINISEDIKQHLNVSKFDYQALDAIEQDGGFYVQIYGVATKDISSNPQIAKVTYEIDKDLYNIIVENVKLSYSYDENSNINGFSSSYSIKDGYEIFTKLDDIIDDLSPHSYVEMATQNTYNASEAIER